MASSESWDYGSATPGQRVFYVDNSLGNEEAANWTVALATEPEGIYKDVNTVEAHQELVHFFGGVIKR